jgi:membrane-associated protein
MTTSADIATVITNHGIAILAPLAVLEGPIVTVVAAYLASLKLLNLVNVILCVIIADVVGDCILYAMGRGMLDWLPLSLRRRFGVSRRRMAQMIRTFRENGVRVLVIGKLTHAAGFAVLFAAGAARMPFMTFVLANLLATIPKSLILVAVGYLFGSAHAVIAEWFSVGSVVILGLMALTLLIFWYRRPDRTRGPAA